MLKLIVYVLMLCLAKAQEAVPVQDNQAVQSIISSFAAKYEAAGSPRMMVYINRQLVDNTQEDLEPTEVRQRSVKVNGDQVDQGYNPYAVQGTGLGGERLTTETVYQRQRQDNDLGASRISRFSSREFEQEFDSAFIQAGAKFMDQDTANILNSQQGSVGQRFLTPTQVNPPLNQVNTLKKTADIVIEILLREKQELVPTPGGDIVRNRIDISATAIDIRQGGAIIGQVSTDTLFGFNKRDGNLRRNLLAFMTPADYADQVSLALMQQIKL